MEEGVIITVVVAPTMILNDGFAYARLRASGPQTGLPFGFPFRTANKAGSCVRNTHSLFRKTGDLTPIHSYSLGGFNGRFCFDRNQGPAPWYQG